MLEERPLQKSIRYLVKIFTVLMIGDIIFCYINAKYMLMWSSIILITGVLLSRLLFNLNKYEQGIVFLSFVFYIIGFFHTICLGNYNTCYFILLVVPIIGSLLLENIYNKIFLLACSSILFMVCNHISGFELLHNYFFYYGLFPSSLLMINFYNRLRTLTSDKDKLISDLEAKNEEILLFSNMMSHDLKAPLRSITGFSKILQKRLPKLSDRDSELFNHITHSAESLNKLINDLLQYSKTSIEEIALEEIDMNKMIDELLITFNYDIIQNKIQIEKGNLCKIYGHRDSLYLVFQNLISNAIKYQPLDALHIPQLWIIQNNLKGTCQISIKDNGIGMSPQEVSEIFEPFTRFHSTKHYEGTGLGMSIVQKIIERHEGTIDIKSQEGKGSCITISIPKPVVISQESITQMNPILRHLSIEKQVVKNMN